MGHTAASQMRCWPWDSAQPPHTLEFIARLGEPGLGSEDSLLSAAQALLALAGSAAWEYIWVEAGQSVPLS